jgi:hypothetical protein
MVRTAHPTTSIKAGAVLSVMKYGIHNKRIGSKEREMIKAKRIQLIRMMLRVGVGFSVFFTCAVASQLPDLPDKTTQDNISIMWTPDGGTPDYGSCTGGKKNWQAALDYISCLNSNNYLGHSEWRMPTAQELASLAMGGRDQEGIAASLNTKGYRNVQSANYWSSSEASGDVALVVDMLWSGYVLTVNKANTNFVWPVRSLSLK